MDCLYSASSNNFLKEELPELNLYEQVLFCLKKEINGEKREYVPLKKEEWLKLCQEYVDQPDYGKQYDYVTNPRLWTMNYERKGGGFLSDFQWLKKKDEKLFEKLFTVPFIMQFLEEIELHMSHYDARRDKLVKWISQIVKLTENDFWEHTEKWQKFQGFKAGYHLSREELRILKDMKKYYDLEFVPDMKNRVHKKYVEELLMKMSIASNMGSLGNTAWELEMMNDYKENILEMFSAIKGFKGMKMTTFPGLMEELIKDGDKEVIHMALMKNFISLEMIKKSIDCSWKEGKSELIPLFLLKKHGEWPEEE